jgi:hypothetical protein
MVTDLLYCNFCKAKRTMLRTLMYVQVREIKQLNRLHVRLPSSFDLTNLDLA